MFTDTSTADDDGLAIPDFLRITPEKAAARKAWNAAHPVAATVQESKFKVERERREEEKKTKQRERLAALAVKKKHEAEAEKKGIYSKPLPGLVWDTVRGGWVNPNAISRAKFNFMMANAPTEKHREFMRRKYPQFGPFPDAQPDMVIETETTKVRSPAKKPLAEPKKASPVASVKSTGKRGSLSKAEQTEKVEAMLLRPEGATLREIGVEMGWLDHSASAFLSGIRKTKTIIATPEARGRVYRLEKK